MAAALCLHGGARSIPEAHSVTQSDAGAFFESHAFEKHRTWLESGNKIQVATVDRLNGVIRALGVVAKRI